MPAEYWNYLDYLLSLNQAKYIAQIGQPIIVTYTSMIYTNGKSSHYGIYRAPLFAYSSKPYVDLNSKHASLIAIVKHEGSTPFNYLKASLDHATISYPAFNW